MLVILLEGAGWCGGIMMVVAYVLVSTRRVSAVARSFQLLNIAGGILLTGTTLYRGAVPNTVLNVVWIVFGSYALIATRARDRRHGDFGGTADAVYRAQLTDSGVTYETATPTEKLVTT